jgi:hypothetical protein
MSKLISLLKFIYKFSKFSEKFYYSLKSKVIKFLLELNSILITIFLKYLIS